MEHFNQLEPDQNERLAILAEELAETIHVIGKILRHGMDSVHPTRPEEGTNRDRLERELGDVYFIVQQMCKKGDVSFASIAVNSVKKHQQIQPYLHHNTLV